MSKLGKLFAERSEHKRIRELLKSDDFELI
jgi:hypothetical protein